MIEKKAPAVKADSHNVKSVEKDGSAKTASKSADTKSAVNNKNRRGVIDNVKHEQKSKVVAAEATDIDADSDDDDNATPESKTLWESIVELFSSDPEIKRQRQERRQAAMEKRQQKRLEKIKAREQLRAEARQRREDKIKNQREFRAKAEAEEKRLSEQRSKAYDEIGEDNVAAHQSPISLVILLTIGLIVSLVDITFLKDIFGRILDLEDSFALAIAVVVGLAAASLMALHGYRNSHSRIYRNWDVEKLIWLALGIILFIMRMVSGYIIEIDPTAETLLLNTNIRVADMVIAPVMLMFYFGSGSLVSYCVEHIYATGVIEEWAKRRNIAKLTRRYAHDDKAAKVKAVRERKQDLKDKIIDRKFAAKLDKQHQKDYAEALAKYNKVLDEVHREYDRISDAVAVLEHYEQRVAQTKLARDRLIDNVENSKVGAQNEVAMLVHSKTGTQVETLQGIIDTYNTNYRRQNQDKDK